MGVDSGAKQAPDLPPTIAAKPLGARMTCSPMTFPLFSNERALHRKGFAAGRRERPELDRDFHFRRPRMDPLYTRKPQRPRESFSSHNRPGSEAVTQPALTSWG